MIPGNHQVSAGCPLSRGRGGLARSCGVASGTVEKARVWEARMSPRSAVDGRFPGRGRHATSPRGLPYEAGSPEWGSWHSPGALVIGINFRTLDPRLRGCAFLGARLLAPLTPNFARVLPSNLGRPPPRHPLPALSASVSPRG
jgi:hypothetical protein